jgi:hypothetical protein
MKVEPRLTRPYIRDSLVILLSIMAMWGVLSFVLREVLRLTGDIRVKLVLVISAVAAGVFATGAFIALFGHLRRNRAALYGADAGQRCAQGGEEPRA